MGLQCHCSVSAVRCLLGFIINYVLRFARVPNLLDLAAALKFQDLGTKKLDFKKIISLRNHNVEISIIFYPGPVILSG